MWKTIKSHPNYEVNKQGQVRRIKNGKVLAQELHKGSRFARNSYLRVQLYKSGVKQNKRVHRLVAEAFLNNRHNLPEVNHKDLNPHNNNINNLEFITSQGNKQHYHKNKIS